MKGYIQGLITGISIMSLMMFNSCETQPMEYRANYTLQAVKDILSKVNDLENDIVELNDYHYRNTKKLNDIYAELPTIKINQISEYKMKRLLNRETIQPNEMKDLLQNYTKDCEEEYIPLKNSMWGK